MIKNFLHRGAQTFFETGSTKGIRADWSKRLLARLTTLDAAEEREEMDVPGWDLHELSGDRKRTWSIKLTANYRMTFRFEDGDALDVNVEDYHKK